MKILLINQPLNNRGDEAAHKALIRTILAQFTNIEIKVLYVDCSSQEGLNQFQVIDKRIKYVNIKSFWWYDKFGPQAINKGRPYLLHIHPTTHDILKEYKWADFVMCAPGGICMGGFQDWTHLFFLKIAKYCNKPLIYYGRSIGPFPEATQRNRLFKKFSMEMLNYASFISLRDSKSPQYLPPLRNNYKQTTDVAFLEQPSKDIPYEIRNLIKKKPYAVFVPNQLLWHYNFKEAGTVCNVISFFSEVTKKILSTFPDLNIIMLPQTFANSDLNYNDVFFFRQIADNINDERILLTADCYSSDIQQTIIKESRFLIGARYHSVVFAINNNVPFLSLSYEHKMSGLLELLGLGNREIPLHQVFDDPRSILESLHNKMNLLKVFPNAQQKASLIANKCITDLRKFLYSA